MDSAKARPEKAAVIPAEKIEGAILLLRGQRVMLDRGLAALYGVETKNLKRGTWTDFLLTSCSN
jgi:hypothetical protein